MRGIHENNNNHMSSLNSETNYSKKFIEGNTLLDYNSAS